MWLGPPQQSGGGGLWGGEQQEEEYLHVVAVLARQLQGQLTSGPGTAIPQPADFRGQLRVLDTGGGGGWRRASVTGGGERERGRERGGRGEGK